MFLVFTCIRLPSMYCDCDCDCVISLLSYMPRARTRRQRWHDTMHVDARARAARAHDARRYLLVQRSALLALRATLSPARLRARRRHGAVGTGDVGTRSRTPWHVAAADRLHDGRAHQHPVRSRRQTHSWRLCQVCRARCHPPRRYRPVLCGYTVVRGEPCACPPAILQCRLNLIIRLFLVRQHE